MYVNIECCKYSNTAYTLHTEAVAYTKGARGAQPPNELKDHPCEKMKSDKKLSGGAMTKSWSQYQSCLLITVNCL